MQNAANDVNKLSDGYVKASEALSQMAVGEEEGNAYADNFRNVTKNLSALNSVYELQLQTVNDHMQSTNQAYEGIGTLIENLSSSIEGTQAYKENIAKLASNLTSLNTVYGNMLTAMNAGPSQG